MPNSYTNLDKLWTGNEKKKEDKWNICRTARLETSFTAISKYGDIFTRGINAQKLATRVMVPETISNAM